MKEVTQKDKISSLTLKAPAKINLFLKVLNRRTDGFHEIESQMLKIELFDILHLSFIKCIWFVIVMISYACWVKDAVFYIHETKNLQKPTLYEYLVQPK